MQNLTIQPTIQTVKSGIHEDFHHFIKDMQYKYKVVLLLSLKTQYNEKKIIVQWNRILLNGKMIGMMVIEQPKPPYETVYALQHMFLKPEYRGKGLGKVLLWDLRQQYKGCKMYLSCYDRGLSHFYGTNGFKHISTGDLNMLEALVHGHDKKYIHCTEKMTYGDIYWAEEYFRL